MRKMKCAKGKGRRPTASMEQMIRMERALKNLKPCRKHINGIEGKRIGYVFRKAKAEIKYALMAASYCIMEDRVSISFFCFSYLFIFIFYILQLRTFEFIKAVFDFILT